MTEPRRTLGLVLSGGGSLGAWQAGALGELERAGLVFDSVLGYSAGALNGLAYQLGMLEEGRRRWLHARRTLQPSLRWNPFSLVSAAPVRAAIDYGLDEAAIRARARCRLVVASAHYHRHGAIYAEFDPRGRWDDHFEAHLHATCAIPTVFPPVTTLFRGAPVRLIDGGVPTCRPFSFRALGPVDNVVVLEMTRPQDAAEPLSWNPFRRADQRGRRSSLRLMDEGVASLAALPTPPRVFRLAPSKRLDWLMLDFSAGKIAAALELGAADARDFMVYFLKASL